MEHSSNFRTIEVTTCEVDAANAYVARGLVIMG